MNNCQTCKWYVPVRSGEPRPEWAECRASAPQSLLVSDGVSRFRAVVTAAWPRVVDTRGCGAWVRREEAPGRGTKRN